MFIVLTIIIFILILGLLIFVHEFGHYFQAKRAKIAVVEFAFGFPPRLFCWKKGQTRFCLNAIPLGGYVNLMGEDSKSSDPRSFFGQRPMVRFGVVIAGVILNFLLAWVLLTFWFGIVSVRPPQNYVLIAQVIKGSPADSSGIRTGDVLISGNGESFSSAEELANFTRAHQGQLVTFRVRRFGREQIFPITLSRSAEAPLGVMPVDAGGVPANLSWWKAPIYAIGEIGRVIAANLEFIGRLIASLFGAPKVSGEVAGPVGIYGILSQMVGLGSLFVLRFAALLSLIVGFFNILPLPALDGGKLLFIGLEGIFGKRVLSEEWENTIHLIGFVILLALVLLITYQDILKLVRF